MRFKRSGTPTRRGLAGVLLAAIAAGCVAGGCAVKRTTRVTPSALTAAPLPASAAQLAAKLAKEREAIQTITATVELEPTAGSVYSGVIKQYHDVRAFILIQSPDHIRMVGQAPVVRTTIFDMASDGKQFRVLIPSKRKFIVGSTAATPPAKNSLENLRPQHILDALLLPPLDSPVERYFLNQEREAGRIDYVLNVVASAASDQLALKCRVWFDASTLEVARVEFYGAKGALEEDVRYSDYHDYQGVRYPARIELERPGEDYGLGIVIQKATFNAPLPAEKFKLEKPATAEQIEVGTVASEGATVGQ